MTTMAFRLPTKFRSKTQALSKGLQGKGIRLSPEAKKIINSINKSAHRSNKEKLRRAARKAGE